LTELGQQGLERNISMKKFFFEKMASVYGWLLVLCIVSFIAVMVILIKFAYLPMRLTPISYMPIPLFFAGVFFGVLAILSYWKMNVYTIVALAVLAVIGIPFMVVGNFFYSVFQEVLVQPNLTFTGVIMDGRWKRDYNLGYGIVVTETICISDRYLVDVYEGTKIYELDTASQQKRQVGIEALQPGQVVDIQFKDLLIDPEIDNRLFAKYDPRGIDTTYLIGAFQITIRKGEIAPVVSNVGNSYCEILPDY
jgi:hypothetical protein